MKPLYYFIVHIPKAVNDTIKVGESELYLDSKFNEFQHRAHEGEVVGIPLKYNTGVDIGDTLYFHHHVVLGGNHLVYNGQQLNENKDRRGQLVDGEQGLYYVTYDGGNDPFVCQAYAHKSKKSGKVKILGEWIFLTPAEQDAELKSDVLELVQKEKEYNQYGYIRYGSPKLEELGLHEGDKVFFMKNADCLMEVDGEKLYRVYLQHIYAKITEEV